MSICRFCREWAPSTELLHYSVRSYAHHRCWLEAGKDITKLSDYRISQFPAFALKDFGLLEVAEAAAAREQERRRQFAAQRKANLFQQIPYCEEPADE